MQEDVVRKRKLFWSWQDEQQESWLSAMSSQGLHLVRRQFPAGFLFHKGPGREVAYRMDFNRSNPTEDYLQLFKDAGWEHLGNYGGWQYWRKEIQNGVIPELFTDNASKAEKYRRLFAIYITSAPAMYIIGLAVFKKFPGLHPTWFVILYITLFMTYILYAAINAIMIARRISTLRRTPGL